jgi:hypothetical protein
MKKIKMGLMAVVILLGIGGAFATKPTEFCELEVQYYYNGSYQEAGEFGTTYYCAGGSGVCTYWKPYPVTQPNYYQACKVGMYFPIYTR